jgi:hypothetical protein
LHRNIQRNFYHTAPMTPPAQPLEFHDKPAAAAGATVLCGIAALSGAGFAAGAWVAWQRPGFMVAAGCVLAALFCLWISVHGLLQLFSGSLRLILDAQGLEHRGPGGRTRVRWEAMAGLRRVRGDDEAAPDTLVLDYRDAGGGMRTLRVNAAHLAPPLEALMHALEAGSGLREQA